MHVYHEGIHIQETRLGWSAGLSQCDGVHPPDDLRLVSR